MGGTVNIWLPNSWSEQSWLRMIGWEERYATLPMTDPLFWSLPDGTLEPVLAEGFDMSADGLAYTVRLRQGVQWSDGEPFTAEDVAYTLHMAFHPDKKPLVPPRQGLTIKDFVNNGSIAHHFRFTRIS